MIFLSIIIHIQDINTDPKQCIINDDFSSTSHVSQTSMISTEMLHASAAYELTSLHMLEVGDIVDFYFSRDRHQSLFFVFQENSG